MFFCDLSGTDRLNKIGQELLDENVKSFNYRYKNRIVTEEDSIKYEFKIIHESKKLSHGEVLKLIDSLEYQSCECPGITGMLLMNGCHGIE